MGGIGELIKAGRADAAMCLADWRRLLKEEYGKFEPFLELAVGAVTGSYPGSDGIVRYDVRQHGKVWLGMHQDGSPDTEDSPWLRLAREDVLIWRLNAEGRKLAEKIATAQCADNAKPSGTSQSAMTQPNGREKGPAGQPLRDAECMKAVYEVGDKFRIEEGFSKVLTTKTGDVWEVPPFTRIVLEILLTDKREGGLTSEMVHRSAGERYLERYPELANGVSGTGSALVTEKPLRQYFRHTDQKGNRVEHALFKQVQRSGSKIPSYWFKKGTVKVRVTPD